MPSTPVIAIFDVGKTNKKLFLFDQSYSIVWETSRVLNETTDEDGDPCEDLDGLLAWIREVWREATGMGRFEIRAINFTAYGASFVHLGKNGKLLTPLYNYLKPYPEKLKKQFYRQYGGEMTFSMITASPVLGSLNSGMQLYRLKKQKPKTFSKIEYALHLPQWLSWLFTGKSCSEITSIGCHTGLWNFSQQGYHEWVYREGMVDKLPAIESSHVVYPVNPNAGFQIPGPSGSAVIAGVGLHDSSAAMIPYLESFQEPFVLISTGTWCISMNPFNAEPLTIAELQNDCLSYLTFRGRPMKSSRLFAGFEHEMQVEKIAAHFQREKNDYLKISFDPEIASALRLKNKESGFRAPVAPVGASVFAQRELTGFAHFEEAYHRLLMDIMDQQLLSTKLIMPGNRIKRIFVDGGFGKNPVYMHLLASEFPSVEVFAATIAQASAIGAAMAVHIHWNERPLATNIVILKQYKQV